MAEYIEREAVRNALYEADAITMKGVKILNQFPAADVAPVVHGRWVHDINNRYGCSECMERETMSPKKLKHFCPNCGADMRGE